MIARFGGLESLARWVAIARALVPGLTGMSGMRYRTFLAYNVAGGVVWGSTFVFLGYALGKIPVCLSTASVGGYIAVAVAAAAFIGYLVFRRLREHRERVALLATGKLEGRPPTNGWASPRAEASPRAGDSTLRSPRRSVGSRLDHLDYTNRSPARLPAPTTNLRSIDGHAGL